MQAIRQSRSRSRRNRPVSPGPGRAVSASRDHPRSSAREYGSATRMSKASATKGRTRPPGMALRAMTPAICSRENSSSAPEACQLMARASRAAPWREQKESAVRDPGNTLAIATPPVLIVCCPQNPRRASGVNLTRARDSSTRRVGRTFDRIGRFLVTIRRGAAVVLGLQLPSTGVKIAEICGFPGA